MAKRNRLTPRTTKAAPESRRGGPTEDYRGDTVPEPTQRTDGTPDDPCPRTSPHMAHRNWRSDDVGVCPGVADTKET